MGILILESFLLGVGLAMDAFSVSLANGLHEPKMHKRKALLIAGIFAIFQGLMPLIGWVCVHTLAEQFKVFEKFIPFIALALLSFIGGKMLYEGLKKKCDCEEENKPLTLTLLLVQGIATAIDALSVGFVIADQDIWQTLISVAIIAAVTFVICLAGVFIGQKFGDFISCKASVLGGVILIIIGLEIFITGII
jgi:putative Mn2+ efflux pump MntP